MRTLHLLTLLAATAHAGTLTVAIEHTFAGEPLGLEQRHTLGDGRTVSVSRLDYLVTEFALLKKDGTAMQAHEQAAFISLGKARTTFTLPGVPDGDYAGVAFRIGVPATAEQRDPTLWPAGHALNPAVCGLHWGWQSGYIYMALEGRYGEQGGYSFHLARAENLMTVRLEKDWHCEADTALTVRLDVASALGDAGLQSADGSNTTHSAAGDARAAKMRGSIQHAWSLRSAQPASASAGEKAAPQRLASGATAYDFRVPIGFPPPELPADNPISVEGVALGERLFFDKRLSVNGTQSCASCHLPERAFTEPLAVSTGAEGRATPRNAPGLLNLAWHSEYARDGRRATLRAQALAPLGDPLEMHLPPDLAVAAIADLAPDFARAFGTADITTVDGKDGKDGNLTTEKLPSLPSTPAITPHRIGLALEQYLLTRTAAASKLDRVLRGEAKLSDEEQHGFELFHSEFDPGHGTRGADCFHCHAGYDFSDHAYHDIGLGSPDPGRHAATGRETDRGKFKTPSLRNVARTAPYMHDGRFATLEEVVAHYDHGTQRTANLDPNLAKHPAEGMQLSVADQQALVAFLKALSDE